MSAAFWVCATVTAVSAFVSLGYSVAALGGAEASSRTATMYASARSLALAVTSLVAFVVRSDPYLEAIALAMVIVQGVDAMVGALAHDRVKTLGPAGMSLVNAAALVWLSLD